MRQRYVGRGLKNIQDSESSSDDGTDHRDTIINPAPVPVSLLVIGYSLQQKLVSRHLPHNTELHIAPVALLYITTL